MKVTDLPKHWQDKSKAEKRDNVYDMRLPLEDAARVAALEDIYPEQEQSDILNDMIAAALDDAANNPNLKDALAEPGEGKKH
ncbi:hypothetical protein QQM79_15055 [Marinobacteraceae bacterium S3BR75-40.1]